MHITWTFNGGTTTVAAWTSLARGVMVAIDGQVVVDDASWAVAPTYRLSAAGRDVTLKMVGAWPLRTRARLTVAGQELPSASAGVPFPAGARPLPWWGHLCACLVLTAALLSLVLMPLMLLLAFAALRASRAARPAGVRVALTAGSAFAAWAVALGWVLAWSGAGRQFFSDGGLVMLPLLALGAAGLAAAVAHAVQAHTYSGARMLVLLALVVGLGAAATWRARTHVDAAVAFANPADAELIRALGYEQAGRARQIALALGGCMAVVAAVGEIRRLRGSSRSADRAEFPGT